MKKLTDKEIRHALLLHLGRRANPPRATLEEVHVCNGNAIADVVAVYKAMHCYEIKGETDAINRIIRQSEFYDLAFPQISLVTTANHLRRAELITPKHWGILLADHTNNDSIIFRYVRGATRNPSYQPEIALLSLWRSELVKFLSNDFSAIEKMNRTKIAALISSNMPKATINEMLGKTLILRASNSINLDSLSPYTQYGRKSLVSESLKE